MPVWPPHLVNRIAEHQWVLFLGSGVSASCANEAGERPPTWRTLLTQLADLIQDEVTRELARKLIERYDLLGAADHIRYSLVQEHNLNGYQSYLREAVEGPTIDRYKPSKLMEILLSLDPRVVFTTNFDKLFERGSNEGYATYKFDDPGLSNAVRIGTPVLVKLHGSVDAIDRIVLTRNDYRRARRDGRSAFEMLSALSLTSTILFVGYSLSDPDIQLVLEAVGRDQLDPEAHFMLLPEPETPAAEQVFRESFGVSLLTYPAGEHEQAAIALKELSDSVLAVREAQAGSP